MISAIIRLLTAIFVAIPSAKEIVVNAVNKSNIAEAIKRKQNKDKAVDEAIDGNRNSDGNS